MYSCYWSPNSTLQEYKDFVSRLEASIKSQPSEVLLTGDFNAKHANWGCPQNDKRGEILAELIDATGLVICNRGNASTFNKGTIIDLTIATPRTAQRLSKWKVLDEVSLSDHFYLTFSIEAGRQTIETPRVPKIAIQRLTQHSTQESATNFSNVWTQNEKPCH
jgi:5-carboxymethyl-2-hydroxymuconate isomerase